MECEQFLCRTLCANPPFTWAGSLHGATATRELSISLSKVITTNGVTLTVARMFYQVVVAAVLLYGSETCCLTDTARRPLDGFHVEAARRITGKMPRKVRRGGEEEWVYPHTADVLAAAGLHPLRHYIDKRCNTI